MSIRVILKGLKNNYQEKVWQVQKSMTKNMNMFLMFRIKLKWKW